MTRPRTQGPPDVPRSVRGSCAVAAVLDDDGNVDREKVAAVATSVLDGRPQLSKNYRPRPKPDDAQGTGPGGRSTSWGDVLKGHK